jgi:hydroxypyruvate isomerase
MYAPNVSWLFPETPFSDRPKLVAQAGFRAVEFGFPSHADIPALEAAVKDLGLEVVLFNQDVPVWDAANRGYLVDPGRREEFRRKLDEGLEVVRKLRARKMMLASGVELPDLGHARQLACMLENLRLAAPLAEAAGVLLTIEVLNPVDNPGYWLTSLDEAGRIVDLVNHPNLRMQLDSYHLALLGYDPATEVRRHGPRVGHIQFADFPGRHEPGTGEIDFADVLRACEETGYEGAIGMEYVPLEPGVRTLAWAQAETIGKRH